jgi:hypothetical protein
MATEWHYTKGGQKHGPVSSADLKALVKSGELQRTDMIWKEGMTDWKPAGSLKGLFPLPATTVAEKAPPPMPNASTITSNVNEMTTEGQNSSPLQLVWSRCRKYPVRCAAIGLVSSFLLNVTVAGTLFSIGLDTLAQLFMLPMSIVQFSLFVILVFFGVKALILAAKYSNLEGKWNPQDGLGEPFEIAGKNLTRGNVLVGTVTLQKNNVLEVSTGGKVIEVWQVITNQPKELVFQDAKGEVKRYKKNIFNPLAALFSTSRAEHLQGSWQPITEENEWVQFTKDGAVVFSDGSAGRFKLIGEEPNEVIELEMVKGSSRQFRIISLTHDQLVIAEGQEATTFRRPKRTASKSVKTSTTTDCHEHDEAETDSGHAQTSKGLFGGLFNFFTKEKCPKCGHYSAEEINRERTSELQQRLVSLRNPNTNFLQQVAVNYWTVEISYCCNDCKHSWKETKEQRE